MSAFWHRKRVLVTGASGFLGAHVTAALREIRPAHLAAPRSSDCDLRVHAQVDRLLSETCPDIVIHLAARVGGIGANHANPGVFFYDNAIMGIQLMELSRLHGVQKFVGLGTVCAYPKNTPVPFREEELWNGYPEETNAPYGLAKKMLLVQGQAYREQYGFNAIHLMPVNLYGPGDHFDLETSHVIPAMLAKFIEAERQGSSEVVLWGTGSPTREFLYVKDAARAILLAAQHYDEPEPVNVGSSFEISIRDLADTIARLVGYQGKVVWDHHRPDGQPRRKLNVERAWQAFGFRSAVDFPTGLQETIDWYREVVARHVVTRNA